MARRMAAIAGLWSGVVLLVAVLDASARPGAPRVQVLPEPPPAALVDAPRTRAMRHGTSGPAWVVDP